MAANAAKIVLSRSQDIPFNKLVLSQANVRKVKAGVSIADLAEDIANRTLLHGLPVRSRLDAEGKETGIYEVAPGGRRYRALELLVKQKRLSRTAPIPCVIRTGGLGEEDSLAENLQRVALHPLDQFRTFQTLRDKGLSEEDIAARFFITPAVVKQRLRLASVSPKLLDLYAEDGMTLDMVMAFSVSDNHDHQEQVWASLTQPWQREPYHIRRALTAGSIPAHDKRAQFVGLDAYVAAGGPVMRDLFTPDDGGWLGDVPLLERLAADKLAKAAETVMEEGWKWIEVEIDFLYGHAAGQRRLRGEVIARTQQEEARYAELQDEYDRLAQEHDDDGEISEEVDQRLTAISGEIAVLEQRPVRYDPEEVARAGCYVSIGSDGQLRVERGYGRTHYVDIGKGEATEPTPVGSILRVEPHTMAPRPMDRRIVDIAAAHDGRYSIDIHLRHDPTASEAFADTHVRRLEAMRRLTNAVSREPDGTWIIQPDHLDRVADYERTQARFNPVTVRMLSTLPLEQQITADGATWLDRELVAPSPAPLSDAGFGREVRDAQERRRQWLMVEDLAREEQGRTFYRSDLLATLRRRELLRVAGQLSDQLGLPYASLPRGQPVEGTYRRTVTLASEKLALIERSRDFTLLPWRSVLDRYLGQQVSGTVAGDGVTWNFGRQRGGPQVG